MIFPQEIARYSIMLATIDHHNELNKAEITRLKLEVARKDEEIEALRHVVLEAWKRKQLSE